MEQAVAAIAGSVCQREVFDGGSLGPSAVFFHKAAQRQS